MKIELSQVKTEAKMDVDMSLSDVIKANKAKLKIQRKKNPLSGTQAGKVQKKKKKTNQPQPQPQNPPKKKQPPQVQNPPKQKGQPQQQQKKKQNQNQQQQGWFQQGFKNQGVMQKKPQVPPGPARLLLRNLDIGVTDADIYTLFAEFGNVTETSIHYDRNGGSLGTGHVCFKRYVDADKGRKQYHGVTLDGRAMNIQLESMAQGRQQNPAKIAMNPARISNPPPNTVYINPNTGQPIGKKALKRLQQGQMPMGIGQQQQQGQGKKKGMGQPMNVAMSYGQSMGFGMQGGKQWSFGGPVTKNMQLKKGNQQQQQGNQQAKKKKKGTPQQNQPQGEPKGKKKGKAPTPTAEELDAELDAYIKEVGST